eukprot:Sspe_Gene.111917::Locus_94106_Transcript_1_1_Confidence_1.000_Length_2085::g.111917::m.111917
MVAEAMHGRKPMSEWTVDDVCRELAGCSWATPVFRHKVRLHRIDGMALSELTKEELRDDFRITELGTIKSILRNIKMLAAGVPQGRASTPQGQVGLEWQDDEPLVERAATPDPLPRRRPPAYRPLSQLSIPSNRLITPLANAVGGKDPLEPPPVPLVTKKPKPKPVRQTEDTEAALRAEKALGWGLVPHSADKGEVAEAASAAGTEEPRADEVPVKELSDGGSPGTAHMPSGPDEERILNPDDAISSSIFPPVQRLDLRRPATKQQQAFRPGILELERRYIAIKKLFQMWDMSSNLSVDGSGFVEYEELREVLASFYGWSDEEKDIKARAAMGSMDRSGDGRLDEDEFHLFISGLTWNKLPRQFDDLIGHLERNVGEVAARLEAERRRRNFQMIFKKWDWDQSGFIEAEELRLVITRYNDWTVQQGKHNTQVLLSTQDVNRDNRLDVQEFLNLFGEKTERLTPEEFDLMVYRIRRCVDDLLEDQKKGMGETFQPVTVQDLRTWWEQSDRCTPLILYGLDIDPSKQIEDLAESLGVKLRAFLVQHRKSERLALADMLRWGIGKGHWMYITISVEHADCDSFLRAIGVLLHQHARHAIHRKFRLWVMICTNRYIWLPKVLRQGAHMVSLQAMRDEKIQSK